MYQKSIPKYSVGDEVIADGEIATITLVIPPPDSDAFSGSFGYRVEWPTNEWGVFEESEITMESIVTTIPAGYRVTFDSWENDADNRSTQVLEGLTLEQAKFYIDFAKMHYSKNAWETQKGFGNMYEPGDAELKEYEHAMIEFFNKNLTLFVSMFPNWELDVNELNLEEAVSEYAWELKEQTIGTSEFYCRVLDSFKVEKVPVEIVLEDVTHEFE